MQQYLSNLEVLLSSIRDVLWQGPLLVLLLGTGLYLTIILRGLQFRYLFHAIKLVTAPVVKSNKRTPGDINPFQSLMTALAGAIGIGNITGIATAVVTGGVGALFWMWVMAFLGMATAYAETLLSVKYRQKNKEGVMSGGPMYTLKNGLKLPRLAAIYALFGGLAAIGIGCMVQSNSMVDAIVATMPQDRLILGIVLAILVGLVIIGGVKSIGKVAGYLVPFMATAYIGAGIVVLIFHIDQLLPSLSLIINSAFTGQAAVGGFLGSTLLLAMQNGVQFGIFANEAGLGTLAIAGASAKTSEPASQGMLSLTGVFVSTMIVCTMTGLVLTVTNVIGTEIDGKIISGSPLAMMAFSTVHSSFNYVVLVGLNLFAFTTILAWSYYGEKCVEYLFGLKIAHIYRWIFTAALIVGAVLELKLAWAIANLASALMAIPNLVALVLSSKIIKEETKNYLSKLSSVKSQVKAINLNSSA